MFLFAVSVLLYTLSVHGVVSVGSSANYRCERLKATYFQYKWRGGKQNWWNDENNVFAINGNTRQWWYDRGEREKFDSISKVFVRIQSNIATTILVRFFIRAPYKDSYGRARTPRVSFIVLGWKVLKPSQKRTEGNKSRPCRVLIDLHAVDRSASTPDNHYICFVLRTWMNNVGSEFFGIKRIDHS